VAYTVGAKVTDIERAASRANSLDTNAESLSVITHSIRTFICQTMRRHSSETYRRLAALVLKDLHAGRREASSVPP